MKKFTCAVLFLFSVNAFTYEIEVSKMKTTSGMQRSFDLTTSLKEKVILDCQSFIQGLRIGDEPGKEVVYMLDPNECQDLYNRIRGSLRFFRHHCMDVEDVIRSDYSCN